MKGSTFPLLLIPLPLLVTHTLQWYLTGCEIFTARFVLNVSPGAAWWIIMSLLHKTGYSRYVFAEHRDSISSMIPPCRICCMLMANYFAITNSLGIHYVYREGHLKWSVWLHITISHIVYLVAVTMLSISNILARAWKCRCFLYVSFTYLQKQFI